MTFIEIEEAKLGKFIKETLDEFHQQMHESRIKWCKAHNRKCIECKIECGDRQ